MAAYRYLIIGSGMTAHAAAGGIREIDPEGTIGMVGNEPGLPYKRPALSKQLWKGKPLDSIWLKLEKLKVDLHPIRQIVTLQPTERLATDDLGNNYSYEELLLATGGTPRRLPYGGEDIIYYRNLADYRRLRELAGRVQHFTVIGGGFIGSEIAAALAMNGKKVSMIFPEEGIGARVYPRDLSQFLNKFFREKSVDVLAGETITGMVSRGSRQLISMQSGREVSAEGVIAGIGIQPNVELALAAGLTVANGIVVDDYLRTSADHIFAAGDVAEFYNPALERRLRVEHEDNAVKMGNQAGRNMAGAGEPYHYLPYFYSDLFELGYEAIGSLDARLEVVADWRTPYKEGVLYYLEKGRVRGVLLWNVWDQVRAARQLIAQPGPFQPGDLKSILPA
jgi:3-phenylpropionate/trans-cinnamate dioxygenase ferredoxin reductase component